MDEVGLMLVCDAVRAFRDERDAAVERDRQAWEDAHATAARALAAHKATVG